MMTGKALKGRNIKSMAHILLLAYFFTVIFQEEI